MAAAGFGGAEVTPLHSGANSRVFRVEGAHGRALLKLYFTHRLDPRDRLAVEFGFCRFAWQHGIRVVPRPIEADPAVSAALYEFVDGSLVTAGDLTASAMAQALDFFAALNACRGDDAAHALPDASEACFSVDAHLACVDRRVARLRTLSEDSDVDREAAAFVRDELLPCWDAVRHKVEMSAPASDRASSVPPAGRCLSPSDFGFHNAIATRDGLRFIDFEYAGWDDPAKTVCDFFCQPAVPVPFDYFETVAARITESTGRPDLQRSRIDLLLPVYRLKWTCIMLNEFLPQGAERRRFAGEADLIARKRTQLAKARLALAQVAAHHNDLPRA